MIFPALLPGFLALPLCICVSHAITQLLYEPLFRITPCIARRSAMDSMAARRKSNEGASYEGGNECHYIRSEQNDYLATSCGCRSGAPQRQPRVSITGRFPGR